MAKVTGLVFKGTGSHTMHFPEHRNDGGKEEVFFYFEASWLGKPYEFHMQASKYTFADGGWSDWRVWIEAARGTEGYWSDGVSDTARQRFREVGEPIVTEWLASEAYTASRHAAVLRDLHNALRDKLPYQADTILARAQNFVRAGEITQVEAIKVADVTAAHEAYIDALKALVED